MNMSITFVLHRGTKRQFIWSLAVCLSAVILLLPAIIWYYFRFRLHQHRLAPLELWSVLLYVIIFGWLVPLGITCLHWYATTISAIATEREQSRSLQRDPPNTSKLGRKPVQATILPPRYQSDVLPAYVYSQDAPWGWLEYCNGNFQGQRLALKRSVITIGRDEHCDIWLDDEMASRHHAELAWCEDQICLTDCLSLNGVFLNGHEVRGSVQVESEDRISVGEHEFVFLLAGRMDDVLADMDDPLERHTWRSAQDDLASDTDTDTSGPLPAASLNEYTPQRGSESQKDPTTAPPIPIPSLSRSMSGPAPLRLPSRIKPR